MAKYHHLFAFLYCGQEYYWKVRATRYVHCGDTSSGRGDSSDKCGF